MLMLIKLNCLPKRRILLVILEQRHLAAIVILPLNRLDDRQRVDALVDVQRNSGHLELHVRHLARPPELRVQMRIVLV